MIKVNNVFKSYDGKAVLENVSFHVEKGEKVALTGPSGAGKTTLMRIISGLEKADKGNVIINKSAKLTYVFQENRLLEQKSVLENILSVKSDKERALYFLDRCGLLPHKNKKAGELSGGMKRRLAIARALSYGGDIYFLDEPLRELDDETLKSVATLIKEETKDKTVLLITHDEYSLNCLSTRQIEIKALNS